MNIESKVTQLLSDLLGDEVTGVTNESRLYNDLGLDSIDVIDLVMQLEDLFEIHINDGMIDELTTVQSVIDCVKYYKESPITL